MSYQVIARKYRPQRFSDVVGQEHVTRTLTNAIQQNRIAHAYLFVGPRGTGKTTIARIFAKCLNCTDGPKVDFSDADPRCQEISEGRSLDVLEIDGASNRGIEEIRELRETVKYAPSVSRFKIYIIDEVHMLTKEAFNALLKTLEEPPPHVKFMFATTEPEKVLPTILSRCQRYDLRRIPMGLIVQHLAQISKLEKVKVDEAALQGIARGSDGCMRDAQSALDQLISFCGHTITESDVLSMFGLAARHQIQQLAGALLSAESHQALNSLNELFEGGKDLNRLLTDLLQHFRNLLLFKISGGDLELLEATENEVAILKEQAEPVSVHALTRVVEVLVDAERRLRDATSKRIAIELALVKAQQACQAVSLDAVLTELKRLRSESPSTPSSSQTKAASAPSARLSEKSRDYAKKPAESAPSSAATPPPSPEPVKEPAPSKREAAPARSNQEAPAPAAVASDRDLDAIWQNLLEAVGRASPFTRTYLLQAHLVSLDQKICVVGFDPEFADHLELIDNAKNRTLLQTKLKELGLGDLNVRFTKAPAPAGKAKPAPAAAPEAPSPPVATPAKPAAATSAPPPASATRESRPAKAAMPQMTKEDFKNDPLIKQALEIFKGEITDIRT